MEKESNVFSALNAIDVNEHVEKKNGLSYLTWAWAWAELKKKCPDANYVIHENEAGWNYFTDGRTCWVKTSVTVEGLTHTLTLPVMDYKNNSIVLDKVTSFDVNKAIMRCLVKTISLFGLGLYIYAGEDLPEDGESKPQDAPQRAKAPKVGKDTPKTENAQKTAPTESNQVQVARVSEIKAIVAGFADPQAIIEWALKKYHKALYCLTDEEYAELTSTLMERVNSKKEGETNE